MSINENRPLKMKFLVTRNFKDFNDDNEKSLYGRQTTTPTALKLNFNYMISQYLFFSILNFLL